MGEEPRGGQRITNQRLRCAVISYGQLLFLAATPCFFFSPEAREAALCSIRIPIDREPRSNI